MDPEERKQGFIVKDLFLKKRIEAKMIKCLKTMQRSVK